MKIGELLSGVQLKQPLAPELAEREAAGLDYDSRRIEKDFVFFAFAGARADGREFANDAVARGAIAVVSEAVAPEDLRARWIQVEHGRQALALASRNFYGKPDERVALTGITGTNGKTTTGFLIDSVMRAAGYTTALIGTIEYRLGGRVLPAVNTTPESLDLVRLFAELEQLGGSQAARYATMEVSSHALELGRVYGLQFHTAVFTNLTRDHLDFHGSMEAYFAAKQRLFEGAGAPPPGPCRAAAARPSSWPGWSGTTARSPPVRHAHNSQLADQAPVIEWSHASPISRWVMYLTQDEHTYSRVEPAGPAGRRHELTSQLPGTSAPALSEHRGSVCGSPGGFLRDGRCVR